MGRRIIISGCSGGGKSTLLEALRRRGQIVVEEPGRRIVSPELACGGMVLPWLNPATFARRTVTLSREDLRAHEPSVDPVFFDRGLIDAAVALEHLTGEPLNDTLSRNCAFNKPVFFAPPWPEIYERDAQRPHGFDEAVAEYERLADAYPRLGYEIVLLPKTSVLDRVRFVLSEAFGSANAARSE